MINSMKYSIPIILTALLTLLEVKASAQKTRCERDKQLIGPMGAGRGFWVENCDPAKLRYLWEVTMGLPKNTPMATIIDETVSEWSYADKKNKDLRDRALYPTLGTNGGQDVWPAPGMYWGFCAGDAGNHYIQGICKAKPETVNIQVLTDRGQVELSKLSDFKGNRVMLLAPDATLANIQLRASHELDVHVTEQTHLTQVFAISLASGSKLTAARGHVFVIQGGKARSAARIAVGDSLIRQDGTLDKVITIEERSEHRKLYSAQPAHAMDRQGIGIEAGYLSATYWYRSDRANATQKRISRNAIPTSLLTD